MYATAERHNSREDRAGEQLSKTPAHTLDLIPGMQWSARLVLCLVLLIAVQFAIAQQVGRTSIRNAPKQLQKAIQCLVAAPFVQEYGLKPLKLKVGDWAWARYYVGSIPGVGDTPREFYVAVYAADGVHGELLLADPNNQGGFYAVRNGYSLTKDGSHWTADEGNGGYELYEAMGRFATRLTLRPRYRVHLIPGDSGCTSDSE